MVQSRKHISFPPKRHANAFVSITIIVIRLTTPFVIRDNEQGWGRVQLDKSLAFEPDRLLILSHDTSSAPEYFNDRVMPTTASTKHSYCATVTRDVLDLGADATVRIVLAWTDVPGAVLTNNLDLHVRPGAAAPWLYGNSDDPAASADTVNVVETIRLEMPETPGSTLFEINVENGAGLLEEQPYSLVALVDDEKLSIVETKCPP